MATSVGSNKAADTQSHNGLLNRMITGKERGQPGTPTLQLRPAQHCPAETECPCSLPPSFAPSARFTEASAWGPLGPSWHLPSPEGRHGWPSALAADFKGQSLVLSWLGAASGPRASPVRSGGATAGHACPAPRRPSSGDSRLSRWKTLMSPTQPPT